jgi:hypothetical protein
MDNAATGKDRGSGTTAKMTKIEAKEKAKDAAKEAARAARSSAFDTDGFEKKKKAEGKASDHSRAAGNPKGWVERDPNVRKKKGALATAGGNKFKSKQRFKRRK